MVSPNNLELDSETSNVVEWSFSMATPSNKLTVQESPISLSTTSTDDCMTTDESVLELREVLYSGRKVSKKARKFPVKSRGNSVKVREQKEMICHACSMRFK